MTKAILNALQDAHAFDPSPIHEDLGLLHVPFEQLAPPAHPEESLRQACGRFERIAITGESGSGKSSLTFNVLGPLAKGLAPIVVPVVVEPYETVSEPRAMFAHIAAIIGRVAQENSALSEKERDAALTQLTAQRPVGRSTGRRVHVSAQWMGTGLGADLARQADPTQVIARSAAETLEVVHQMLAAIQAADLTPVLVFDDTDRWLRGSAYAEPEALADGFFGRVLPALGELRCSIVVAVHNRYLDDEPLRDAVARVLETRIDLPAVPNPEAVAKIIGTRANIHLGTEVPLNEVVTPGAVEQLFELYRSADRGGLRTVLRTAHTALTDACDMGAEVIAADHIVGAQSAWDT